MLISTLDVSHRCTSCANYSRDGLPNFFCAMYPAGVGVDAGTRNICTDWQPADFNAILHAIVTTLSTCPSTQGQSWRIVQLVQPPKQVMYAVVQVDRQVQIWAVYQWHSYNSTLPNPEIVVEEWMDFERSIEWDAPYVVWSDNVSIDADVVLPQPLVQFRYKLKIEPYPSLPINC
ncbi:MAG: hypothetical protein HC895_23700 [Leptolyngbyaceae cyanobacterium SM1_3_5]|nr:hypothetical protein [Leptolyngbyaceae cyanobacterium SM1_3_5]